MFLVVFGGAEESAARSGRSSRGWRLTNVKNGLAMFCQTTLFKSYLPKLP